MILSVSCIRGSKSLALCADKMTISQAAVGMLQPMKIRRRLFGNAHVAGSQIRTREPEKI